MKLTVLFLCLWSFSTQREDEEAKAAARAGVAAASSTPREITAELQAAELRLQKAEEQLAHAKKRVEEQSSVVPPSGSR